MKTKTYNVFKFKELSKEAREKALEAYYNINVDYDWWDYKFEEAKNLGFEIKEFDIYYNTIKCDFTESAIDIANAITKEHGNTCKTYLLAKEFLSVCNDEKEEEKIEALANNFLEDIEQEYLALLKSDYDYLTTEEAIIETIEANDYDFTIDGKID